MAAVSEEIVREYFELHEFLVRQYRKHVAPAGREDDDVDFLISNPRPQVREQELPFVLSSADLPFIERGIVVIKAWHTEIFSPALLNNAPDLFRFLEKKSFQHIVKMFADDEAVVKIVIVPVLPRETAAREQSVAILRAKGIDAVISFPTMLADLVSHIEARRNYQKSDLLQMIRILRTYDFLKEPQLELFKTKTKRGRRLDR
ncbi:MAG TPA: hypothetical protein VL361_19850 [Candidatus Limnocylindrales bacterium]|jgi:hypothetical protein|nr:hypothetical protein [Candidatus Limnocylindrales bacterium]